MIGNVISGSVLGLVLLVIVMLLVAISACS
jgi:hypothetical protein